MVSSVIDLGKTSVSAVCTDIASIRRAAQHKET